MYKILVADDEEKIRLLIRKYAEFEGHTVIEAENGMDAVKLFREEGCDIVVMDVMMPELDGFSACKQIRKTSDTPILMLSARGEEYDKISGFEFGADDYVVKPFSPKELMMRIEAIMKRYKKSTQSSVAETADDSVAQKNVVRVGGITVDYTGRYVYVDGERIEMSPKEYELFFYMVRNKNIALSREKLITEVWGYDFYGDDRTLDTHIKLLRKSLGKYSKYIVTLRGVGYRFEVVE